MPRGIVAILLRVENGAIEYGEFVFDAGFPVTYPCERATASNTDVVRLEGDRFGVEVDERSEAFAPGFTAEATGTAEIEFEMRAAGAVTFRGGPDARVVRFGTLGANVNGDDDVDVSFFASPRTFSFVGGAGADDVAATGGNGTGDVAVDRFMVLGGEGDDRLAAGAGPTTLAGMSGDDVVLGGPQRDVVDGGPGDDHVSGGPGGDSVYGDAGRDRLVGGANRDRLDGGAGRDRCRGGPGPDVVENCER